MPQVERTEVRELSLEEINRVAGGADKQDGNPIINAAESLYFGVQYALHVGGYLLGLW